MLAPGEAVARRVTGFMQHLRLNGFVVGPAETQTALETLSATDIADRDAVRLGLKTLLTSRHEEWMRFDDLFEAYWSGRGRVRERIEPNKRSDRQPAIWVDHLPEGGDAAGASDADDEAV